MLRDKKKKSRSRKFIKFKRYCYAATSRPSLAQPCHMTSHENFCSSSLFLLCAAVRLLPRVAWSSLFSDETKRQLYHRVLKLHVGCYPGQALSVEILQPVQYGNGRAEGEDRTYLCLEGRAPESVSSMMPCCWGFNGGERSD